jgi:allophanate hydrolase subunit 2
VDQTGGAEAASLHVFPGGEPIAGTQIDDPATLGGFINIAAVTSR